jgi:hypothetical protein
VRLTLIAIAAGVCASSAAAQSMNAESFYQRAVKLKGKGAMAIFSMGEVKMLMKEAQEAAKVARAKRLADTAAGRNPRYCPPEQVEMSSDEFLGRLGRIPVEDRRHIDMTEASTRIMSARYPCRG